MGSISVLFSNNLMRVRRTFFSLFNIPMSRVHLYDVVYMIFRFKITVYDCPKEIKIIDMFYTCGANLYGQVLCLLLRH